TLKALTDYIADEVLVLGAADPPSPDTERGANAAQDISQEALSKVKQLSEKELEALIDGKLQI
ncbi:MAG: hypothetical protein KJO08_03285, partial [Gammaproteobacteria bacterium]|nr:hypothetical protein [Gammaproteobacteria bacterium]